MVYASWELSVGAVADSPHLTGVLRVWSPTRCHPDTCWKCRCSGPPRLGGLMLAQVREGTTARGSGQRKQGSSLLQWPPETNQMENKDLRVPVPPHLEFLLACLLTRGPPSGTSPRAAPRSLAHTPGRGAVPPVPPVFRLRCHIPGSLMPCLTSCPGPGTCLRTC